MVKLKGPKYIISSVYWFDFITTFTIAPSVKLGCQSIASLSLRLEKRTEELDD